MSRRRRGNRQRSLIDDVDAGELQWLENSADILIRDLLYVVVTVVVGFLTFLAAIYRQLRKR
jgi:hypothetical protein